MDAIEFGRKIREMRKKKGITLTQLGDKIDLTQSYLSYIENGKKGMPKPETIKKLAYGLNVSYLHLMELAGYTKHQYYIDEIFDDIDTQSKKKVTVELPSHENIKDINGAVVTKVLNDDELRRRLFDLYEMLNMNVDLYYKNNYLSDNDKEKIKTMLKTILE